MNSISTAALSPFSTTLPSSSTTTSIVMYILYTILGVCAILVNLLIIVAILQHKELRVKYVLPVALAGGDLLMGFGYVIAGATRLALMQRGIFGQLVSRLVCAERIYTPLFIIGTDIPALMDLVVSIDRFCAIARPMKYFTAPKTKYALIASGVVYTFCFVSMSFVFVAASIDRATLVSNACFTSDADGPTYSIYDYCVSILSDCTACVIYGAAVHLMVVQNRRLENDLLAMEHLKRQMKVTKLMAIVVGSAAVLFVLPNFAQLVIGAVGNATLTTYGTPVAGVLIAFNSMVNFVIYATQREELRNAFLATLRLKKQSAVGQVSGPRLSIRRATVPVLPLVHANAHNG